MDRRTFLTSGILIPFARFQNPEKGTHTLRIGYVYSHTAGMFYIKEKGKFILLKSSIVVNILNVSMQAKQYINFKWETSTDPNSKIFTECRKHDDSYYKWGPIFTLRLITEELTVLFWANSTMLRNRTKALCNSYSYHVSLLGNVKYRDFTMIGKYWEPYFREVS